VRTTRLRELTGGAWWTLAVMVLCMVALGGGGVVYTGHVVDRQNRAEREAERRAAEVERQNDRRWCALLVTMDDQYRMAPPASETGRRVAAAMAYLRESFGCPGP